METLTRTESKSARVFTQSARALVPDGRPAVAFEVQGKAPEKAAALAHAIRTGAVTADPLAREIHRRGKLPRVLRAATKDDRKVIARFVAEIGLHV